MLLSVSDVLLVGAEVRQSEISPFDKQTLWETIWATDADKFVSPNGVALYPCQVCGNALQSDIGAHAAHVIPGSLDSSWCCCKLSVLSIAIPVLTQPTISIALACYIFFPLRTNDLCGGLQM